MAKANYDLPNDKIEKVMKLSGAKSKREALVIALDTYLRQRKLRDLAAMAGQIRLQWSQRSLRRFRGDP